MKLLIDMSKPGDKARLYKALQLCKPKLYEVEVKQHKEKRTDRQRRYYFGVIVKVLASELGYTKDEMHEVIKHKFAPVQKVLPTGEVIIISGTTTTWDISECETKHEEIKRWAAQELDVYIPDPGEMIEV